MIRSVRGATTVRLATTVVAVTVAGSLYGSISMASETPRGGVPSGLGLADARPNIVLILADDLDVGLVSKMRNVRRLARSGVSFDNSFVVDSLCCPSRASTFTGMFPHNTGVRLNTSDPDDLVPVGGYAAFQTVEDRSFAVVLQDSGYSTAFMGKYVNGYHVRRRAPLPPGWDVWNAVSAGGYRGWNYKVSRLLGTGPGHRTVDATRHSGLGDRDYVQNVLRRRAVDFISAAEPSSSPYFLEVAPYGTHSRVSPGAHSTDPAFPPALRDRPSEFDPDGNCGGRIPGADGDCSSLNVHEIDGFGQPTEDNRPYLANGFDRHPGWLPAEPLEHRTVRLLNRDYRNRVRMAQSVDRIVGDVVATAAGEPTYIFFTSDNGFRLGQFRLGRGKGTAYTPDISVPLVVGGTGLPTIVRGTHREEVVQNIDLAPTFEQIAASRSARYRDGVSLLPLIERIDRVPWRTLAYVEHSRPPAAVDNPDGETSTDRVPSYSAVRSADALFVESLLRGDDVNGKPHWDLAYEYYNGLSVPRAFEEVNAYRPGDLRMEAMREALASYRTCAGRSCRRTSVQP